MLEADFIVVGAGSAGCALASRLSEDGRNTVLVVEHGGSDAGPLIQMPAAFSIPMNMPRYDWGYVSEPEPHLNGRRFAAPRGKVIGGTSSINGMVYVRGHRLDFDAWADLGAAGWAYRDVLPYFRRMENCPAGDPHWRGTTGPLHVARGALANPLYAAFIEAGRQAGYPLARDYNGASQEGLGPLEMTVFGGRRWSAANAYLRPALRRRNLRLLTRTMVEQVLFADNRATGVRVRRNGRAETLTAHREVILCASAFNSPKLMMQSGIGPAGHLRDNGIDVRVNRPGVGANLQDHLEVYVQQACRLPISLNGRLGLIGRGGIGLRWLLTRAGLGATNHFEAGGFLRSRADVSYPDLQLHFLPAAIRYNGAMAATGHGYQVHIGPMRSRSRGAVRLAGPDPAAPPRITFNYMSDPSDWSDFRAALRVARHILGQPAFAPYRGRELSPGAEVQSDAEVDAFLMAEVESAYHPCGSCRMGAADDPGAVVDPHCRVIGVDGLRVVDSSIFPQITNGNLNAPSIMVGEKAADHILGRRLLEADERFAPIERAPPAVDRLAAQA